MRDVIKCGNFSIIATHGPLGEYGHDMHKRLYRIVKEVTNQPVLTPVDECEIKNYPLANDVIDEKTEIYQKYYPTEMFCLDQYSKWFLNEKLIYRQ